MAKKLTQEEFIEKSKLIYGDKFDYSKTVYVDYKTKVILIDKESKIELMQAPNHHLEGKLPKALYGINRRITQEEFIRRCNEKHNFFYDYSKTIYNGARKKVIIIDPEFGEFEMKAWNHMQLGQGHPKRGRIIQANTRRLSTDEFIKRAKEVHGEDKYDYSLVDYKGCEIPVKIICKTHNFVFEQIPINHVNCGHGCPKCGNVYRYTQHDFIELCKSIHGDKYTYEKTVYSRMTDDIIVTCKIHGDFKIKAVLFIHHDVGCPCCYEGRTSKSEKEVFDFVKNFSSGEIKNNTFSIIKNSTTNSKLELDIFIPDLNIAFEFNGTYWHSTEFKPENKYKHLNKTKLCEEKGIKLFHIWESNWLENRSEVEDRIKKIFDTRRIEIPKDDIVEIDRSWPEFDKDEMDYLGYELIEERDPISFCYKDKHTLYDCGKLIYKRK